MRSLLLLATVFLAATANAQGAGSRKSGAPDAPAAAPTPIPRSIAVVPFATAYNLTPEGVQVRNMLAGEVLQAFQRAGGWTMIDRLADAALQQEADKSLNPENMQSVFAVATDGVANAQYVLMGFMNVMELVPSRGPDGSPRYDARLDLNLRLYDVASRTLLKSHDVTALASEYDVGEIKEVATEEVKKEAGRVIKDKILCGIRRCPPKSPDASNVVSNVLDASTPTEAWRRATGVAGRKVGTWVSELSNSPRLNAGGQP